MHDLELCPCGQMLLISLFGERACSDTGCLQYKPTARSVGEYAIVTGVDTAHGVLTIDRAMDEQIDAVAQDLYGLPRWEPIQDARVRDNHQKEDNRMKESKKWSVVRLRDVVDSNARVAVIFNAVTHPTERETAQEMGRRIAEGSQVGIRWRVLFDVPRTQHDRWCVTERRNVQQYVAVRRSRVVFRYGVIPFCDQAMAERVAEQLITGEDVVENFTWTKDGLLSDHWCVARAQDVRDQPTGIHVSNVQAKDPDGFLADIEKRAQKYGRLKSGDAWAKTEKEQRSRVWDEYVAVETREVLPCEIVAPYGERTAREVASELNANRKLLSETNAAVGPASKYRDGWCVCHRSSLKEAIAEAAPSKTMDELVTEMELTQRFNDSQKNVRPDAVALSDDHRKAWKARLAVRVHESEERRRQQVLVDLTCVEDAE